MTGIYLVPVLIAVGILRAAELFWLEKGKKPGRIVAGWTLPLLSAGYALVLFGSIAEFSFVTRRISLPAALSGLLLFIARIPLKFWAARTLDIWWSPHIEIREGHRLIKDGPYRYIRHPAYLSAMIDLVAVPLIANAYYTLCSVSLALLCLLVVRMRFEEKALIDKFGEEYLQYMRETGALLPVKNFLQ